MQVVDQDSLFPRSSIALSRIIDRTCDRVAAEFDGGRETPRCAGGSVSWRKSGTSCARRPSISRARRAGEPLQSVDDHRCHHGVKRLCQVIGIARSSYYHWKAAASGRAARAAADARLAARVRTIHRGSTSTYGVPQGNRRTPRHRASGQPQASRPGHATGPPGRAAAAPPTPHHHSRPSDGQGCACP